MAMVFKERNSNLLKTFLEKNISTNNDMTKRYQLHRYGCCNIFFSFSIKEQFLLLFLLENIQQKKACI